MKRLIFLLFLLLFVIVSLASALTQIQPGERGVVRRFGRIVDTPGPGLYLGLPWGMDQVDRVPVGLVRRITVGFDPREQEENKQERIPDGQLLTGDHNLINLQVEIYYTVLDDEVPRFVLQADRVDTVVTRTTESALAEWVAGRSVDDVLLRGKAAISAWLVPELGRRLRPYGLGMQIQEASITYLNPPAEVKNSFDEVARAQTEIRTKINGAEQEADRRQRDADAQIYEKQRSTASYANEQYLQAKADAENFLKSLEQYRRLSKENPNYVTGIWQDQMTRLYSRMRQNGRLDLLDRYLTTDGLDITEVPVLPKKR